MEAWELRWNREIIHDYLARLSQRYLTNIIQYCHHNALEHQALFLSESLVFIILKVLSKEINHQKLLNINDIC